jgi:hypothetical protein
MSINNEKEVYIMLKIENVKRQIEMEIKKCGDVNSKWSAGAIDAYRIALSMLDKAIEDSKYNGWSNYETWNYKLWLDNDKGTYYYMQESAKAAYDEASQSEYSTKKENAIYNFAEFLKDYIEENNPLSDKASMYSDLLNAEISEINFREIAIAYMEDIDE